MLEIWQRKRREPRLFVLLAAIIKSLHIICCEAVARSLPAASRRHGNKRQPSQEACPPLSRHVSRRCHQRSRPFRCSNINSPDGRAGAVCTDATVGTLAGLGGSTGRKKRLQITEDGTETLKCRSCWDLPADRKNQATR